MINTKQLLSELQEHGITGTDFLAKTNGVLRKLDLEEGKYGRANAKETEKLLDGLWKSKMSGASRDLIKALTRITMAHVMGKVDMTKLSRMIKSSDEQIAMRLVRLAKELVAGARVMDVSMKFGSINIDMFAPFSHTPVVGEVVRMANGMQKSQGKIANALQNNLSKSLAQEWGEKWEWLRPKATTGSIYVRGDGLATSVNLMVNVAGLSAPDDANFKQTFANKVREVIDGVGGYRIRKFEA